MQARQPNDPLAVADENIHAVARIELEAAHQRSSYQRISEAIAGFAGREGAVAWHAVVFAGWVVLNAGILPITPFDPFPFILLTTIVSLEAIFLSLFVLASQNRLTDEADRRARLDLQVDLLAEREMTMVLRMLKEICDRLGVHDITRSTEFTELMTRTDVEELAARVERSRTASTKRRRRAAS